MIQLLAKLFARWFFKSHEESIDVAGQIIALGEAKKEAASKPSDGEEPTTHVVYWQLADRRADSVRMDYAIFNGSKRICTSAVSTKPTGNSRYERIRLQAMIRKSHPNLTLRFVKDKRSK